MNPGRKQSVLVVDDAEITRLMLRILLQSLGVEIIYEAENGARAVEIFRQEKPDLTLLDVNMPVMGGHDALEIMLGENPDTHVVMLTAEGRGDVVEACLAAGAKGYIRKDLPPDELKTHFNALLKGEP